MQRLSQLLFVLSCCACTKYLAKVSDQSLPVPTAPGDFQAYLDNNLMVVNSTPGLGPLGTDDFWIGDSLWSTLDAPSATAYDWQADIFQGQASSDSWNRPYTAIYYANVVLDGISQKADSADPMAYDSIRGSALFYRAFHSYHLEETFGQPYQPASAGTDLGIPLRVTDDLTARDRRATVAQVYTQILADLQQAAPLLSRQVPWLNRNRPSRPAAFALLTEVCLTMQDYADAKRWADSALSLYSGLVRYDTVDAARALPFSLAGNDEVLFQCSAYNYPVLYDNNKREYGAEVDTTLYASYSPNDLRLSVFFKPSASGDGGYCFRGSYTGQFYLFSGLSVDLVLLSRAECRARLGDITGAMDDLNKLLVTRYRANTYVNYTAGTQEEALQYILMERRKETLFREVRWTDLRRLNQEPAHAVYLYRVLRGRQYVLAPMDKRYTYPIPSNEIQLSGIQQNGR
ncbi:MAG TPA: RagB/SusD family nutrient uptake outer membrane protein [Puia sp.]|nr:RagB/SusD family nutrient uptake outer membrane protein [Puia sp.]